MKVTITEQTSPKSQEILQALQDAVTKELDKKRRLGQPVVIWQDGQPVLVDADVAVKAETGTNS
ncbi:MAG: hypothetical protein KF908_04015 [Nitrosomonas sp.]|nr:hypothetical protein [Nitrosomonas sp.]